MIFNIQIANTKFPSRGGADRFIHVVEILFKYSHPNISMYEGFTAYLNVLFDYYTLRRHIEVKLVVTEVESEEKVSYILTFIRVSES